MWRRLVAPIVLPLASLVTACSTVVPVHSPTQYIPAKAPRIVWVTTSDKSVVRLLSPEIIADSLAGYLAGGDPFAIPLTSVQSMRARAASTGRTALLLGGIFAAGGIGVYLVLGHAGATQCAEDTSGGDSAVPC